MQNVKLITFLKKKAKDAIKVYNYFYLKNWLQNFHEPTAIHCFVNSYVSYWLIKYLNGMLHWYFVLSPNVLSCNV